MPDRTRLNPTTPGTAQHNGAHDMIRINRHDSHYWAVESRIAHSGQWVLVAFFLTEDDARDFVLRQYGTVYVKVIR